MFNDVYRKRRVLVTGHTGFKGSWLCLWLKHLGADVTGYALEPSTTPSHHNLLRADFNSVIGDLRARAKFEGVVADCKPEMIFHLAAQPIVSVSYEQPIETMEVNALGTMQLLDIARRMASVKAVVIVTSDKCYDNDGSGRPLSETAPLGGSDPYSASKACAEIISAMYAKWRKLQTQPSKSLPLIATARGGNVIGGGDWSPNRIMPDIVRALYGKQPLQLRRPDAVRPWQHVLDALRGYLLLGQKLLEGDSSFEGAWNFGPRQEEYLPVSEVVDAVRHRHPTLVLVSSESAKFFEHGLLRLDCSKANKLLCWTPIYDFKGSLASTLDWYHTFYSKNEIISLQQLIDYLGRSTAQ